MKALKIDVNVLAEWIEELDKLDEQGKEYAGKCIVETDEGEQDAYILIVRNA